MYGETIDAAASLSVKKRNFLRNNPLGYLVASGLSGIYVGFGIILIFCLAAPFVAIASPAVKLIMGACFGIALTLVIFAGCELYTSNVMFMTFGWIKRKVSFLDSIKIWTVSWIGSLLGCLLLAKLVIIGNSAEHAYPFFEKVAAAKMSAPAIELFARAILCNMLVCLAVWITLRTKSDSAKLIVIFWCLFGFIGAGYEHSIANMTLLTVALFANPDAETLSWAGFWHNLIWVTLGNFVGGAVMIAGSYLVASKEYLSFGTSSSPSTPVAVENQ